MKTIQSQRYQLGSYEVNKVSQLPRQTLSTLQWNIQLRLWSLRDII